MNAGMKMLLATSRDAESGGGDHRSRSDGRRSGGRNGTRSEYRNEYESEYANRRSPRNEYGRYEMNDNDDYEPEDRFRDRRGREHYDNGRYAPMRNHYEPEDNYRRDSRTNMHYPSSPYVPPVYAPTEARKHYGTGGERRAMNRIGFALDDDDDWGTSETGRRYNTTSDYNRVNEIERERGEQPHSGYAKSDTLPELTQGLALEWTKNMENVDGTKGAHWTMEQAKQVMAQKNVSADPAEFFVALNMMYSDYCGVAKHLGVNNIDFYVAMAKAFLEDPDAGDNKIVKYFECVVNG